jgi:signal transduction histidine kinase
MAELLVRSFDGKETHVPLAGERLTLGRSSENPLAFPSDGGLSRFHLAIEPQGTGWAVVNLGSKNGTFVNGERVEERRALAPGDCITASRVEMVYLSAEAAFPKVAFDADTTEPTTSVMLSDLLEQARGFDAGKLVEDLHSKKALQTLARAAGELAVRRPLKQMFELVLQLTMEAIRADRGVLLTLENGELVAQASSGEGFRINKSVRERVLNRGESLMIERIKGTGDMDFSESMVIEGIESVLAVPLQSENSILGMIYVDSSRSGLAFTRDQLDLLTLMANLAGVSIERERWEQQRREMLAENAATLGRLAAALSHEINSPLGALRGAVDTLLRLLGKLSSGEPVYAQLGAELRKSLEASLERMGEVVGRIQRFTNLDRSEAVVVNVNEMLKDVIELEKSAGAPGLILDLEAEAVQTILCRPLPLNSVFVGLLRNAMEAATHSGNKRVTITTQQAGTAVEIRVADSGPGMDPAALAQAFNPTFRVIGARMGAANWSLFTFRRILREQGGEIRLESELGKGTTVIVTLPATPSELS